MQIGPIPAEVKDVLTLFTLFNGCGLLAIAFYAGKLSNRVDNLEKVDQARTAQATDIAVMKSQLEGMGKSLDEMKKDLHEMGGSWSTFQTSVLHKKLTSGD